MSTLNCSVNFPLTVEDKVGRMVTANPAVTLVEVASTTIKIKGGTTIPSCLM